MHTHIYIHTNEMRISDKKSLEHIILEKNRNVLQVELFLETFTIQNYPFGYKTPDHRFSIPADSMLHLRNKYLYNITFILCSLALLSSLSNLFMPFPSFESLSNKF